MRQQHQRCAPWLAMAQPQQCRTLFRTPEVPRAEAAAPLPTPDDPEIEARRRRERQALKRRRGRAATILTSPLGDTSDTGESGARAAALGRTRA